MLKIKECYYLEFTEETSFATFPKDMVNKEYRLPLGWHDEENILSRVMRKCKSARFSDMSARLYLLITGISKEGDILLVDTSGCVRFRGTEYYLYPGDFLYLYCILNRAVAEKRR